VRVFVLALALQVGALPLLANACLISCERAAAARLTDAASGHSCHATASKRGLGTRLQQAPVACSHDHHDAGGQIASEQAGGSALRSVLVAPAIVALTSPEVPAAQPTTIVQEQLTHAPPPSSSFARPLRV